MLTSQIFVTFLNTYWTDVLHLGENAMAFLSIFPLISAVLIAIGNFAVGLIVDRTRTSQGKARPYLLLAGVLIAVSTVFMFAIPSGNQTVMLVWIAVSYIIYYSVAYPLYSVSNSLMVPLSTRNEKQRSLLSSVSGIAGTAASSFGAIIMPMIVPFFNNDKNIWLIYMSIIAAVSLMFVSLQYYFTRERITEEGIKLNIREEKVSLGKQLKALFTEKYWVLVMIFFFIFQFVGAMQNFSMAYYCNYILGTYQDGFTQTVLGIVTGIPFAAAVLFVWPLTNKIGIKNSILFGLIISAAGCLIAFINPYSWVMVVIGLFLKCLGAAPAAYVIYALIADVLDHVEAKNGFRCDGLSVSVSGIIMSVLQSLCQGIFNGMLNATGYIAPTTDPVTGEVIAAAQNAATNNVFVWCYIGFMMIGYVICAIIIIPIDVEKRMEEDHKTILERQKAKVLADGGVWIDPQERLRLEQEEADKQAEENRREELRARCAKKGLNFEEEEARYQARREAKKKSS
ncbi:MAG: MFS transporter [Clostridia bacterium]|nr:MFS transporter [Clostridia bacterium]